MKRPPSQRDRLLNVLRHGAVAVMILMIIATAGIGVGVQHAHRGGHLHHGQQHDSHAHPHPHCHSDCHHEHKHGGTQSDDELHVHVAILGINLTLSCFGDGADARVQKSALGASEHVIAGGDLDESATLVDLNETPASLFQVLTFVESVVPGRLETPAAGEGFSALKPACDLTGCDRAMPLTPPPEFV